MRYSATPRVLLFLLVSPLVQATPAATLTANEAKNHIGENATVCGVVASSHYADGSRGNPTFVNLDKPHPNQLFTILIWGEDLPKFSPKPSTWDGKRVCATGVISPYRGTPEIVAKSPEIVAKSPGQITVAEPRRFRMKPVSLIRTGVSLPLLGAIAPPSAQSKAQPDAQRIQAPTCSKPWMWHFCSHGDEDCDAGKQCRNDVIQKWLSRRRQCESAPEEAASAIERSCKSCNKQYCSGRITIKSDKAEGYLDEGVSKLVYKGSREKCYNVKFVSAENTPPQNSEYMEILVYVERSLETTLQVGQSTDLCGKRIDVYGQCPRGCRWGRAYWRATEDR